MEKCALEEEISGVYEVAKATYRQIVNWRENYQGPKHLVMLTSIYCFVLVLSNMRNNTGRVDELYRELMSR
jgi:hypothetical protein